MGVPHWAMKDERCQNCDNVVPAEPAFDTMAKTHSSMICSGTRNDCANAEKNYCLLTLSSKDGDVSGGIEVCAELTAADARCSNTFYSNGKTNGCRCYRKDACCGSCVPTS